MTLAASATVSAQTAAATSADGYIRNVSPNGDDAGDEGQRLVRGTLRIAPTGLDGRLELLRRRLRFTAGRIVEEWMIFDELAVAAQAYRG